MQRSHDKLIAARPLYRALAGLLCLGEVGVVAGMCGVVIYEQPSGWDWLIVAVFFAAGIIGTGAFGFVAIKGRGPRWLLKWSKARLT
jgi:hypothetical protein